MIKALEPCLWLFGNVAAAFLIAFVLLKRKRRKMGRPPVTEKMLRPPGESLRIRLEALDEDTYQIIGTFIFANILAAIFFEFALAMRHFPIVAAPVALFGALLMGSSFPYIIKHVLRYANHRLGFHGERMVGECLNQLMLDGCRIFHDMQIEGKGNIDHIIVSQRGVFAVETKTRRKPGTEKNHKVIFTGTELQYPTWTDQYGLKQAMDNARWLEKFLTQSTGESVTTAPILTLPGWWVELRGKSTVNVLNPKQIRGVVLDTRLPIIGEAQFKRICYQLDQKCRDVDL